MLKGRRLRCSFCGKDEKQVAKLVAGPRVFICDACVAFAQRLMSDPTEGVGPTSHAPRQSWLVRLGKYLGLSRFRREGVASLCLLLFILTSVATGSAGEKKASNKHPLSFGTGQVNIDLQHVVWEPLKGEGIPPGFQMAPLRGDLATGGGELLVRLPANSTFPNHSHTSKEFYVWIQGDFTYIAEDGTATPLSQHSYISLPGGVPHTLKCGKTPCVFYARYPAPFEYKIHPMPAQKK